MASLANKIILEALILVIVLLGLMCVTTCFMQCKASTGLIEKDGLFSSVIAFLKNGVRVIINIALDFLWLLPPWVRNCLTEFYCFFDGSSPYSKCVMYVIKCAVGEVSRMSSCFLNLGGDIAIDFYYNGVFLRNYDYGQLSYDVFDCAGYDLNHILGLVEKTFKGKNI